MTYLNYVNKFQQGGAAPTEEDQQIMSMFLAVPEAFRQIAEQQGMGDVLSEEAISNIKQMVAQAQSGDERSAAALNELTSDPSTVQLVKQLYESAPEVVNQAVQAMQTQAMKKGGKMAYLQHLKKGGSAGVCKDCAKKFEEGGNNPGNQIVRITGRHDPYEMIQSALDNEDYRPFLYNGKVYYPSQDGGADIRDSRGNWLGYSAGTGTIGYNDPTGQTQKNLEDQFQADKANGIVAGSYGHRDGNGLLSYLSNLVHNKKGIYTK